ncbi:MAG: protein kinase [Phycisphaerales bacterium]|nr:MAG: protein kinase [Phycisphaerales bacterium]
MTESQDGRGHTSDAQEGVPTIDYGAEATGVGAQIGPYKLLRIIGEGGCGMVYMAEQRSPVTRRVALKVIKPGMDTKQVIARFEAERQALALLDHPNIASVHDAGTTKTGRPYFVMEYVRGVSVTEHCDREKLGIEARLRLFLQVCEAVQYAHQKGIIHRDIKPSNIQVAIHGEKAVPKIIDFGLAKALSQLLTERTLVTEQGQMVGTPEYMSPEQAEMTNQDIDTRTDVYSLGAVLYELLTGTLPFDPDTLREGGADSIRRMIREKDPKTPSTRLSTIAGDKSQEVARSRNTDVRTLSRKLHGDLDWITLKAMEKDRMRRYQTAHALAEDIERHLHHEPVLARRPGRIYRMRKFLRRNRAAVLGCLAALILIVAMIGLSAMYLQGLKRTSAVQAMEHRTILSSAMELCSKGQFQEALDKIESILSSKHVGADARLLHARLTLELEGPTEAAKELEPLLSERDEIACQAHFLLARVYLENATEDAATAAQYQQRAKEHQDAGEKLFSESAEACFNRSMMAGTVNKTLDWLNRALELDPGHYDSLQARAQAYYALKDYDQMETDASMMIGNRPSDSQGYALRAIARREKAIREDRKELFEKAVQDHSKAIGLARDDAEFYDQRRRTHMQMGNYEPALTDARTCVRLQPDQGSHHFNAFCALVALGRYDEAKSQHERIIDSGLMTRRLFNASAEKYVSDTLAADRPWHPGQSVPQDPAFMAMHESTEIYQQLAQKARRVVPEGFCPTWSPDGTELAYSSGLLGFSGIEILNLASGRTRLLTVPGFDPAWSLDGRYIAFTRTRRSLLLADVTGNHEREHPDFAQREVWLIKADGSEAPRFLAHGIFPSWSSDPGRVYYQAPQDWKFYSISIAGGEPVPHVQCRGACPVVSADGRHVACKGPNKRLEILDMTTGSVVVEMSPSMASSIYVGWSRNGRELCAAGGAGGDSGLWIYELDPSMQITKTSHVLSGSLGRSGWPRPGIGRLAIQRHIMGYYREIWVVDLDPNLSTAEALGPGRTIEEHYQEMIDLYTRRIQVDPEDPDSYVSLASVYLAMGNKEKALEDLDSLTKSATNLSAVAATLGGLGLSQINEDPGFALELFRRAHEIQPGDWRPLWGLGAAHGGGMGQLDQAIAKYTESTKLPGGDNSINYFCLAMAHGGKGQRDEAVSWYQKAMAQMPADKKSFDATWRAVLEQVRSMASSQLGIGSDEQ